MEQLESQINAKINNATRGTDVSYWESLLDSLRPFMAKQRLKEVHAKMLQMRLKRIREEQISEMANADDEKMEEAKKEELGEEEEEPTTSSSYVELQSAKEKAEKQQKDKVGLLSLRA